MLRFALILLLRLAIPFAAPLAPGPIIASSIENVDGGDPRDTVPIRTFNIPSASMEPTLQVGDYIIVSLHAGYTPARGDVIVFIPPNNPSTYFVKRVIAIPGDRIAMQAGRPVLNGEPVTQTDAGPTTVVQDFGSTTVSEAIERYTETLPGAHPYDILHQPFAGPNSTVPEQTIPPGKLFVLGDNRDDSLDSRFRTFGLIPFANVVGPARLIYWSHNPDRFLHHVH